MSSTWCSTKPGIYLQDFLQGCHSTPYILSAETDETVSIVLMHALQDLMRRRCGGLLVLGPSSEYLHRLYPIRRSLRSSHKYSMLHSGMIGDAQHHTDILQHIATTTSRAFMLALHPAFSKVPPEDSYIRGSRARLDAVSTARSLNESAFFGPDMTHMSFYHQTRLYSSVASKQVFYVLHLRFSGGQPPYR